MEELQRQKMKNVQVCAVLLSGKSFPLFSSKDLIFFLIKLENRKQETIDDMFFSSYHFWLAVGKEIESLIKKDDDRKGCSTWLAKLLHMLVVLGHMVKLFGEWVVVFFVYHMCEYKVGTQILRCYSLSECRLSIVIYQLGIVFKLSFNIN